MIELVDGVTPNKRVTSLEGLPEQNLVEALIIDLTPQGLPLPHKLLSRRSSFVVSIVEVLNDSLVGFESLGIRYVMEPQQQVVGSLVDILINLSDLGWVLTSVTSSVLNSAIHS